MNELLIRYYAVSFPPPASPPSGMSYLLLPRNWKWMWYDYFIPPIYFRTSSIIPCKKAQARNIHDLIALARSFKIIFQSRPETPGPCHVNHDRNCKSIGLRPRLTVSGTILHNLDGIYASGRKAGRDKVYAWHMYFYENGAMTTIDSAWLCLLVSGTFVYLTCIVVIV